MKTTSSSLYTPSGFWRRSGFTLVEVLVAITVLVVVILLVAQLTNSATITTVNSQKRVDADAEARMVFDRIGNDFAAMPKRPDVDYFFWKNTGTGTTGLNDMMYFFSEAPGYFSGASKGA